MLLRCGLIRQSTAKGAYVTTCIGPMAAEAVLAFFKGEIGKRWLARMAQLGIAPVGDGEASADHTSDQLPLAGKTFVLTGTLASMDRESAGAKIRALGGKVASAVSKNTTYLVAGANTGATKSAKAAQLGVAVIDEPAFLAMIGVAQQ